MSPTATDAFEPSATEPSTTKVDREIIPSNSDDSKMNTIETKNSNTHVVESKSAVTHIGNDKTSMPAHTGDERNPLADSIWNRIEKLLDAK